jgi:hypothetical protein
LPAGGDTESQLETRGVARGVVVRLSSSAICTLAERITQVTVHLHLPRMANVKNGTPVGG